jgi:hypothetical protein
LREFWWQLRNRPPSAPIWITEWKLVQEPLGLGEHGPGGGIHVHERKDAVDARGDRRPVGQRKVGAGRWEVVRAVTIGGDLRRTNNCSNLRRQIGWGAPYWGDPPLGGGLKGGRLMRSPSKGAIYRRLGVVVLAIAVLGLVAVPVALGANPSMTLYGVVHGTFYGGQRPIAATVTVPNPTAPTGLPLAATRASADGLFIMTVPFSGLPLYYGEFTVTATALSPTLKDWSHLFSTGRASFEFSAGGAVGIPLTLVVKNTRVSGTVKNAKTTKALKGVKVTVGNKSVTTSMKGKYSLAIGLWPATRYRAKFAKKGFYSVTKTFSSAPGSGVSVNVALKKK